MGRWSRAVGKIFLDWVIPSKGARWLDIGCGTGVFTQLVLETYAPEAVVGIDPATAQIDYARKLPVGQLAEFRVAKCSDCVNRRGENKRHCRLERLIGSAVLVQALLSAALGPSTITVGVSENVMTASLIACWTLLIVRNVKIFGPVGRCGRVRPAATERLAKPTRIPAPTAMCRYPSAITISVACGSCSSRLDLQSSLSVSCRNLCEQEGRPGCEGAPGRPAQRPSGPPRRFRYRKVDAETGDEVDSSDIVKGYEVGKGQYIEIEPEELESYRH
jgi:Ku70/Ku80 beta-barrel domain/Methyltransferase domain